MSQLRKARPLLGLREVLERAIKARETGVSIKFTTGGKAILNECQSGIIRTTYRIK